MRPAFLVRPLRFGLLALAVGLGIGCEKTPSRFDAVQQQTRGQRATAKDSAAGGDFNKFFPKSEGDFSVIYTQEKRGFAEAEVKKGGEVLATLAVSDTRNNPQAADKYKGADLTLDGYPEVAVGSLGTAILIENRIQVQVRSKDAGIDQAGRESWIRRFDLPNLAAYARTL